MIHDSFVWHGTNQACYNALYLIINSNILQAHLFRTLVLIWCGHKIYRNTHRSGFQITAVVYGYLFKRSLLFSSNSTDCPFGTWCCISAAVLTGPPVKLCGNSYWSSQVVQVQTWCGKCRLLFCFIKFKHHKSYFLYMRHLDSTAEQRQFFQHQVHWIYDSTFIQKCRLLTFHQFSLTHIPM